jgi:hypothetical protein
MGLDTYMDIYHYLTIECSIDTDGAEELLSSLEAYEDPWEALDEL